MTDSTCVVRLMHGINDNQIITISITLQNSNKISGNSIKQEETRYDKPIYRSSSNTTPLASQDKCCKILELVLYCLSVIIESHLASQTISMQDIPTKIKFKVKKKKKVKALPPCNTKDLF